MSEFEIVYIYGTHVVSRYPYLFSVNHKLYKLISDNILANNFIKLPESYMKCLMFLWSMVVVFQDIPRTV